MYAIGSHVFVLSINTLIICFKDKLQIGEAFNRAVWTIIFTNIWLICTFTYLIIINQEHINITKYV